MNIHKVFALIFAYTRRWRMRRFESLLEVTDRSCVLDVGGTPGNWGFTRSDPSVAMLNLRLPKNLHTDILMLSLPTPPRGSATDP